jgi:hypothetical protein
MTSREDGSGRIVYTWHNCKGKGDHELPNFINQYVASFARAYKGETAEAAICSASEFDQKETFLNIIAYR